MDNTYIGTSATPAVSYIFYGNKIGQDVHTPSQTTTEGPSPIQAFSGTAGSGEGSMNLQSGSFPPTTPPFK